jgi:hypothetical protein
LGTEVATPSTGRSRKAVHKRTISGDVAFPRASFLNSVCSADLKGVVERAISESEREDDDDDGENDDSESEPFATPISFWERDAKAFVNLPIPVSISNDDGNEPRQQETPTNRRRSSLPPSSRSPTKSDKRSSSIRASRRQSAMLGARATSKSLFVEWEEETEVRNLYQLSPPAALLGRDEVMDEEDELPHSSRPRPSMLNQVIGLAALKELIAREHLDTPDSSVGDDEHSENGYEENHLTGCEIEKNEQTRIVSPMASSELDKIGDIESSYGEQTRLLAEKSPTPFYGNGR